jgi:hypothetical protein
MASIKLKNEIGVEQIYNNINEIKIPTVDGSFKTFSESGPTVIESSFSEPVVISGSYNGTPIEVTSNGTVNLDFSIALDKKIPLGITVNIKDSAQGTIEITNTDVINVSEYATARVLAPDLKAENIKKDVTILGVNGTADSVDIESIAYARS